MNLPESVQEIADVIGRERALYLIGQLPPSGSRSWRVCFYVPKRLKPDHQLVEILGWHDAVRMVRTFGGEILQPSNCNFIERHHRNRRLWELKLAGHSNRQIAEISRVKYETVRKLLRGDPPEDVTRSFRKERNDRGSHITGGRTYADAGSAAGRSRRKDGRNAA